jgi:hypothetical protein
MWKKTEDDDEKKESTNERKCTINREKNVADSGYKREESGASNIYYDYV